MPTPSWVSAFLIAPVVALLVLVGVAVSWWLAGILFGPALVIYLYALISRRRRFANRNANP